MEALARKTAAPVETSGRYSTAVTKPLLEEGAERGFWAAFIGGPRLAPGPSLLVMLSVSGVFWVLVVLAFLVFRHALWQIFA